MFHAEIDHTQDTCLRLALVQDKLFGTARRAVRILLALIPAVIGLLVGFEKVWGILLLVLGVMFYYTTSWMYERDAEKAFNSTPEKYRHVSYVFNGSALDIESGGISKSVDYGGIFAFVCDGEYYYLFINSRQAYMAKLTGQGESEERFEAFIAEKTGKECKLVSSRESFVQSMRKRISSSGLGGRK